MSLIDLKTITKTTKTKKTTKKKKSYQLRIGESVFPAARFQRLKARGGRVQLHLHPTLADAIQAFTFADLSPTLSMVRFDRQMNWTPLKAITIRQPSKGEVAISFQFLSAWEKWNKPWTIKEYLNTMTRIVNENRTARWTPAKTFSEVLFNIADPTTPIHEGIKTTIGLLRNLHDQAVMTLLSSHSQNSLVLSFEFPPQVKIPCEQYLLYFVQFLSDLGIDATADIQHQEAGNLLFSIKPNDKNEALDKIRRALDVYLQLPEKKNAPSIENQDDPRVQSLIAEIHSLHGKLSLRAAEIQYKDATIGVLQQANDLQRKLLTGDVMLDSLKYVGSNKEVKDKEEFLDGMISLTELEGKGYKVNLPRIYRKLKEQLFDSGEEE